MVAGREAGDADVVVAGIQPTGEAMKMVGLMTMQEAAITSTVRATLLVMGGTQEINLIQRHAQSRMIPAT